MKSVPIPRRMARLDRDPRGYPIPYVVLRAEGRAHFTINDEQRRQECLDRDWCPICGTLLARDRWFVGGALSAFHEQGAYVDTPMHDDCAHYALRVCPYLAAPSYGKRIDDRTLNGDEPNLGLFFDDTMIAERPEVFVAVLSRGHDVTEGGYLRPRRPYLAVEVWRHGQPVTKAEAVEIVKRAVDRELPQLRRARFVGRG